MIISLYLCISLSLSEYIYIYIHMIICIYIYVCVCVCMCVHELQTSRWLIAQTYSGRLRQATPPALTDRYKRKGPGGLYRTSTISPSDSSTQRWVSLLFAVPANWERRPTCPTCTAPYHGLLVDVDTALLNFFSGSCAEVLFGSNTLCVFICVMQYLSQWGEIKELE